MRKGKIAVLCLITSLFVVTNCFAEEKKVVNPIKGLWRLFLQTRAKPAVTAKTAKPAIPARPAIAAKPAIPAKPAQPAQPAQPATPAQPAAVPQGIKDMKKEDIVKEIVRMLGYNQEMLKLIPGLEMAKDESGAIHYTLKDKEGKVTKLEDLDRETLESMFLVVRSDMIRRNTEMTTRQMREIKRIQDMNRQMRELRRTRTPVTTTYKPPALPPKVPKPTYTPPRRRY